MRMHRMLKHTLIISQAIVQLSDLFVSLNIKHEEEIPNALSNAKRYQSDVIIY